MHDGETNSFLFPALALILGIVVDQANKQMKFMKIPDSVLLFLFATFSSILMHSMLPEQDIKSMMGKYGWDHISPSLVLKVLLPPLLFESSIKINAHMFVAKFWKIILLTMTVYVMSMMTTSGFLIPVLEATEGWCYSQVFMFSSIIVATDPVAVVAILEEFGAPHRLRILVEGESLLNDGLALFAFQIIKPILKMETGQMEWRSLNVDWGFEQLKTLLLCLLASPVVGWLAAIVTIWTLKNVAENKKKQVFLIIVVYSVFVACEEMRGSSAIGLVIFGLTVNYERERLSPDTWSTAVELWGCLGYWANVIIFTYAGLVVGSKLFDDKITAGGVVYNQMDKYNIYAITSATFLSTVPLFARVTAIYFFYQAWSFLHPRDKIYTSDYVLLAYSGLRGALGLILALELRGEVDERVFKQILLAVSASVFACLVFQGMTFSLLATREGTTKRSKYIKDTESRLMSYVRRRMLESLSSLQKNSFFSGTNWHVVRSFLNEAMVNPRERPESVGEPVNNKSREKEKPDDVDAQLDDTVPNDEIDDVRTGYYGIMLAETHEAWKHGNISGYTAFVVISLLEHGIDEGNLVLDDYIHFINQTEMNRVNRVLLRIADAIYHGIRGESCLTALAKIGESDFAGIEHDLGQIRIEHSRGTERWWLWSTLLNMSFSTLLTWAVCDGEHPNNTQHVLFIALFVALSCALAQTVMCHSHWKRRRTEKKESPLRRRLVVEIGACMVCILLQLTQMILICGSMYRGSCISTRREECSWQLYTLLAISHFFSVYKLTRAAPMLVFVTYEYLVNRQLSADRVRMSVLNYLHHLSSDRNKKISPDLFTAAAYNALLLEQKHFLMTVDALTRFELKRNDQMLSITPVVKTRQSIRMASWEMDNALTALKADGLLPEDSQEAWYTMSKKLRGRADVVLWIPQLKYRDWLMTVTWIQKMNFSTRSQFISTLADYMNKHPIEEIPADDIIETRGKQMIFIKLGVIKITEWTDYIGHQSHMHEYYLHQGEFLATRNVLLAGWRGGKLPLKWPKKRYQTTTACEVIRLGEDILKKMEEMYPSYIPYMAEHIQGRRALTELREVDKAFHMTTAEQFLSLFQRSGQLIHKTVDVKVPEGKLAILGCWTKLLRVRPQSALTPHCHVQGPARIMLQPIDNRGPGLLLTVPHYVNYVKTPHPAEEVTEKSNISLLVAPDGKMRDKEEQSHVGLSRSQPKSQPKSSSGGGFSRSLGGVVVPGLTAPSPASCSVDKEFSGRAGRF